MSSTIKNGIFVSLAPYFLNEGGHYHAYHQALQEAMEKYGYVTATYIPHECEVEGLNQKWVRHFHYVANNRLLLAIRKFPEYFRLFYWLRSNKTRASQILFLESYGVSDMPSILLAVYLLGTKRIHLWHVFREGWEHQSKKRRVHMLFSKLLAWRLKERYSIFSDSTLIINSLSPYQKNTITLLPIPHIPKYTFRKDNIKQDRVVLWFPGSPRADKGIDEVIKFCKKQDPTLEKFELRIVKDPAFVNIATKLKIDFFPCHLGRDEYLLNLSTADAALFPYDPWIYSSRTSGPFVEAICAGKIVFVKAGSWLANELTMHDLTECILDWDADDLPSRMLELLNDPSIKSKFETMQSCYREFHSQATFEAVLHEKVPCKSFLENQV